ncbi:MAG: CBS domain-containing protein [Spirochaetaceae bacterium]|nr:CBS domain-containing protein [Spirochaetaceae bacterium]
MNLGVYLEKKKGRAVNKIGKNKTIRECVDMLNEKKVGALIVTDDSGNVEGIISGKDVLIKGLPILDKSLSEIMTPKSKMITSDTSENIIDVMKKINDNRIRHMPVVDKGEIIGIVSIGDVIKELLDINIAENEQLKRYIHSQY